MNSTQTILFLSANPKDTSRLRIDQELRDIDEGLRRTQHRDQFRLEQRSAVRPLGDRSWLCEKNISVKGTDNLGFQL